MGPDTWALTTSLELPVRGVPPLPRAIVKDKAEASSTFLGSAVSWVIVRWWQEVSKVR